MTPGRPKSPAKKPVTVPQAATPQALLGDLRALIDASMRAATVAVNAAQTQLYWRVGQRIRLEILGARRAEYGKEIVATLSRHLKADYGRGFEEKNPRRMVRFPQDPNGEPASVLLERIHAACATQAVSTKRRDRKTKEAA